MSDSNISENIRAEEWLRMTAGKWRLQTLQHRGRYNIRTGEYKQLPTRLRRFLNGTPVGMISRTLEMLKNAAPYRSPVFNWEYDESLEYRPTVTLIRKDGPEVTTNGKDSTYTIIQDLLLMDEDGEAFGITDASSCSQISETEYHWDEADVVECPEGAQGVGYQITNVSRDGESDLFSYQVRKVQAITQHLAEHVVKCDGRRRVTVETWDNVYGSVGSYRYDDVVNGGQPISLPEPCSQEDGMTVDVSVSENADCTFKIQVQRTEAIQDLRAYSIFRDQYKIQESDSVMNAADPLSRLGVEYSGGVMTKYQSEKNDDGTWNNTVEKDTERPVPSSTYEYRKTTRGVLRTRVDTNQPSAAAAITTDYGSYKYTKTPGGLFTNEYSEYVRTLIDNLGMQCTDTAFMHVHERQSTVDEVGSSHVPAAANGLVTSYTYSTDADGFVTKSTKTNQEHTVVESSVGRTVTLLGTTSTYRSRSVAEAAARALLDFTSVGKTVRIDMTDGRMRDVEVSEFTRSRGAVLGLECSKTIFNHTHEGTKTVDAVGGHADDAGGGMTYRRSYSVDPQTGGVTERLQYGFEITQRAAKKDIRVTPRGTTVSVTNVQVPSPSAEPTSAGRSLQWEKTPGGLYTETVTSTTPRTGSLGEECTRTQYQHQHQKTTTKASSTLNGGDVTDASGGVIVRKTEQLGDDGLWLLQDQTTTEREVLDSRVSYQVGTRGRRTTITDTQTTVLQTVPTVHDTGRELSREKTPGRLFNVTRTSFEANEHETGADCSQTAYLHRDVKTEIKSQKGGDHVDAASGGLYCEVGWRQADDGTWDRTEQRNQELLVDEAHATEYRDAFGTQNVHDATNSSLQTVDGGVKAESLGTPAAMLQSITRQRTNGNIWNVKVTKETPIEQHTPWFQSRREWHNDDNKFTVIQRWMEFRNATEAQVKGWINEADKYDAGEFENCHFSIGVNPSFALNKFKLYDGRISINVQVVPKNQAGGSTEKDNFEYEVTYMMVSYSPTRDMKPPSGTESQATGHFIKTTRWTTRKVGGGVGYKKFRDIIKDKCFIEGSAVRYEPAGQRFSYDIITKMVVKNEIVTAENVTDAGNPLSITPSKPPA